MWRSFFYALSVSLMVLGGEALIFESAELNPQAKLPPFIQRIMDQDAPQHGMTAAWPGQDQYAFGGSSQSAVMPNATGPSSVQAPMAFPVSSSGGNDLQRRSRFGPSRFVGSAAGGYGGGRISFQPDSRSGQRLAPTQLASMSATGNHQSIGGPGDSLNFSRSSSRKVIVTKDWMPWSLIAVGGVIFLYTHSSRRRYPD